MQVKDIMSADPVYCAPETPVREVARMMVDHDCGAIPVCDDDGKPLGIVTDRDIVCRLVATGENPLHHAARDCMSEPPATAHPDMDVAECARLMEECQVRRLPVIDDGGVCCGVVAQADLATKGSRELAAKVVEAVSERSGVSSNVAL